MTLWRIDLQSSHVLSPSRYTLLSTVPPHLKIYTTLSPLTSRKTSKAAAATVEKEILAIRFWLVSHQEKKNTLKIFQRKRIMAIVKNDAFVFLTLIFSWELAWQMNGGMVITLCRVRELSHRAACKLWQREHQIVGSISINSRC